MYLEELGIPRGLYGGNFIHERKMKRFLQRMRYGFDYRDVINMDISFAEWIYSHMRMYLQNSVHDDTYCSVEFDGKIYTIEDAVKRIIDGTGAYIQYSYNSDISLDYTRLPEIIKRFKKSPDVYDYSDAEEYKIQEEFAKCSELFLKIFSHCWM